ncbi:MAG: hypothetical protein COA78_19150 [Blastopirellula sp.]|nr:MAG: hypothetical protein COA78_19150 [Blastopirellula sp.]
MFLYSSTTRFRLHSTLAFTFLVTCLLGCGTKEPTPTNPVENKTAPVTSVDEPETELPSEEEATPVDSVTLPQEEPAEVVPSETPETASRRTELEQGLANLQIPPVWLADITTEWDINKPWKDGRIEIRRLLGKNDQASQREAIKLTWDYLQKDDIGNGHELPMYLFLGNEPIWAVHAYRQRIADPTTEHPLPDLKSLASLYQKYDMFEEAKQQLDTAMKHIPGPPWTEMREAEIQSDYGSLYAAWGKTDMAKKHYSEAIRLFPTAKPPYGKHLLPQRAKKVQSKLDLLSMGSLTGQTLKDGKYQEKVIGYSGDINITMVIANGKVAKLDTRHQEKIDQNACKLIPQRIIEAQSLQVDGVSGATVSKDAIIGGTLQALKKAGLK